MARDKEFIPEEKIAKALDVFWEKGYNATSMQDLVDAMQINRSSLYNSFGDKHNLFLECLRTYGYLAAQDYESVLKLKDLTPLQTMERIIDVYVTGTIYDCKCCMGMKSSFELAGDDEEVRRIIKQTSDRTIGLFTDLLSRAKEQGEIAHDKNPSVLAHIIFNGFCGWKQSFIQFKDADLIKEMAAYTKKHLRN
ncbi:TetR/AcrR family transcriptional regulator [Chitinophaga filiformis]|uniref:TetR/AcrR family transcriptional regulator n=1 Tax=Chitinophaga filiformis TaxID=104663 RepID=A0ABY4HUU3_CHIFI|nr:TetR/AcrR family transcriptional regulator [Chitinophaga filiformis]UPK67228.1 TetR/AcrR family transcriptional regulator [Chitinophaga filiformis]